MYLVLCSSQLDLMLANFNGLYSHINLRIVRDVRGM